MTNDANKTFADALTAFVTHAQAVVTEHYTKRFPNLTPAQLTVERGNRYVRIVRNDTSRSVYGFVDTKTGYILKAASWKAPAKGPRGSIYEPLSWSCAGPWGLAYSDGKTTNWVAAVPVVAAEAPKSIKRRRDPKPVYAPHVCSSLPCERCMST